MALNLLQTAIDPKNDPDQDNKAALNAMLEDTQSNFLSSHGRTHSHHIFVQFTANSAQIKAWLAMMADKFVTSAHQQILDAASFSANEVDGGLFVNLCLSASAYRKLGDDVSMPDDPSFVKGAKGAAKMLNDPPPDEIKPFVEYKFSVWVTMRGGEYLFVPSISFLKAGAN